MMGSSRGVLLLTPLADPNVMQLAVDGSQPGYEVHAFGIS